MTPEKNSGYLMWSHVKDFVFSLCANHQLLLPNQYQKVELPPSHLTLLVIMYTSGSTGLPKGIVLLELIHIRHYKWEGLFVHNYHTNK